MKNNEQVVLEISAYFGCLPPFFAAAQETPEILENLWQQTLSAYINNPLPELFREKLFAYLSRYCSVPYCLVVHSGNLLGLGTTPSQVLQLLESPAPTATEIEAHLQVLAAYNPPPTSLLSDAIEKAIFSCCIYTFLHSNQNADCCNQLQRILGLSNYNHLNAFLAYIKICHLWVEAHPTLAYQIDRSTQAALETLFTQEPRLVEFFRNYNQLIKRDRQQEENDISDRIVAQEQLQQDLFRQLTENIHQVFWIAAPDKQILYVSPAYEEIWGCSRQELYENPASFIDSVHPEDRDRVIAAWPKQVQKEYEVEYRIIHSNGSTRWIRDRAFPILNQQGEITRIVGIADDITERQQLQQELRESEERLRLALAAARMGTWDWNILTNKITWSDNLEPLFGMKKGTFERTYEAFIQCIHPQDRKFVEQSVIQSLEEAAEYNIEFRVVYNGTIRWVASKGKVFRDPTGKPVRMTGVDMDITARKRVEEQLRLLESVVVNAKDAILITEAEPIEQPGPRIVYANAAFTRMTGYTCEEVIGKNPRFLQGTNSDRATLDKISAALKKWQPICAELINYHKDGSQFWVEINIVPVADETGCHTYWVAIQRDISDRKRAEAEHQQLLAAEQAARTAAETANRTKDEFLAIVSHELRSPLNAMLGWARLLRTRKFDQAKTAQALEIIERNALLQTQLIEDLLDISRIIRGKLHLHWSEVNLKSVIQAASDVVRSTAESKNIQLNFTFTANAEADRQGCRGAGVQGRGGEGESERITNSSFVSHPSSFPSLFVSGDPVRLQQIVWNLLSNAVKFTPEGGQVEVRLSVVNEESRGTRGQGGTTFSQVSPSPPLPLSHSSLSPQSLNYAQITVSDTGKGISPEFLPCVFDRFRQADSTITRSQAGLGLGLAIVRSLVELHHGTVRAESAGEGQGSTFTVKLPLLQESRGAEEQESRGEEDSELLVSLDGFEILVVDDEADAREFITTVLEQYKAKVTAVTSVAEALEAVERSQPDVLVSDIGMPGENGYSLIRKLRQLETERGGNIPAIALTAYARTQDQAAAIAAGFQFHVSKPVEPAQLAALVASIAKPKPE